MILRPRFIVRATLVVVSLLALMPFVPAPARAIQLRWSTGSTDLTVTQNTQAVLVVQADSGEVTLPNTWRLLWTTDSLAVQFTAFDPNSACLVDTAKVDSVAPPQTPADSAANQVTAWFCSSGSNNAGSAHFITDLAGGSHGKLKVVALDPTDPDSSSVLESNEVTFNGGVGGDYAPAILRAAGTHTTSTLEVRAVGANLGGAQLVEIAAPDTSWRLALHVGARTSTTLAATAQVASDLPPYVLRIGGTSAAMGTAQMLPDTPSPMSLQPACVSYMREYTSDGHTHVQPKDFAIVAGRDSVHIFYIRNDDRITDGNLNETTIGHKRSRTFGDWDPSIGTMIALQARSGQWDNLHVWAPSIIKKPNDITYWMFYTGVRDTTIGGTHTQVQRIGRAWSTDLNIWTPESSWVYSHNNAPTWAEQDSSTYAGQQFRDPFVMADPDSLGHYLMFFVAGTHDRSPDMVVGVARSDSTLRHWYDVRPLWNTDYATSRARIIESPHTFTDPSGRWWLYYSAWTLGAPNDSSFVCFQQDSVAASSPIDATLSHWTSPDTLYRFFGGDQTIQFWHASECLDLGIGHQYLCAFDDSQHAVDISEISWHGQHAFALNDSCAPSIPLAVEPGHARPNLALAALGPNPAASRVALAMEAPSAGRVCLALYDVCGRRITTLVDRVVPLGRQIFVWDGRGRSGDPVGSGVYFARLTAASGQRVAKVVIVR